MGDFNRRGTPVSKIMSYDRYNMKRIFATLACRDKINFNVYFRVNISDGQVYDDFLLLTLPQQIFILKKFISNIYGVDIFKIVIENMKISSIEFKARILSVPTETELIYYDLINVKNAFLNAMNTVLGSFYTLSDLDPLMTFVKNNQTLPPIFVPPPPEPITSEKENCINIFRQHRSLHVVLPPISLLSEDLEYSEINNVSGINGFFKIYFTSDLQLSGIDLPVINGSQVTYNATQRKLSLEKLNSIILDENKIHKLLDSTMLTADTPRIEKIEFQLVKNKTLKIYTTSEMDSITYDWITSNDIRIFFSQPELVTLPDPIPDPDPYISQKENRINIYREEKELHIVLPTVALLSEELEYSKVKSTTGINGFFKVYFKTELHLTGEALPKINGVPVEYDANQLKLSLEKLNTIVLPSGGIHTLLKYSMVEGRIPSIKKIEFQLMKNRVHKIYTTSPQDAITYEWLTSTDIRSFYGRPEELPELEIITEESESESESESDDEPVVPVQPCPPHHHVEPEVSPSVQLVDGTYQIEFGSRWEQNQKFIFTISESGTKLIYDAPQNYLYIWNSHTNKYMDGRYFLDFKEDLSVFDNNEKGIYFVTEVAPQPEEDTIEGIVIDGYLTDAKIYQDKNYDNIPDDSELLGKSDILGNFNIEDVVFDDSFSNLGAPILMAVGGIDTSSLKPNIITLKTYPEKDKDVVLSIITTLVVKLAKDPERPDINSLDKAKTAFSRGWSVDKETLFDDPIKTLNSRVFEIMNFLTLYVSLTSVMETSTQNRSVIIEDTLLSLQRILVKGVTNENFIYDLFTELKNINSKIIYDHTILTNVTNIKLKLMELYQEGLSNDFDIDAKRLVQVNNEFLDYVKKEMIKPLIINYLTNVDLDHVFIAHKIFIDSLRYRVGFVVPPSPPITLILPEPDPVPEPFVFPRDSNISIFKEKRRLNVVLPSVSELACNLEYGKVNENQGIFAFFKIYFKKGLSLSYVNLPNIDGVDVKYNPIHRKLSLEEFHTIILSNNRVHTMISEDMLLEDIPDIDKVEFQLFYNGSYKVYTTSNEDAIKYGWLTSKSIKIFNGKPISIIKKARQIDVQLPDSVSLSSDFEYNNISSFTGVDAFFKIYFKESLHLTSNTLPILPEINDIRVEYDDTQKKLSLEKLNHIILPENTTTTFIDETMLTKDLPDIEKIELQLMKNGSLKIFTTDVSDAELYGWELSDGLRLVTGAKLSLVKSKRKLQVRLPSKENLGSDLNYSIINEDIGVDSLFKIYFNKGLSLASVDLPTINDVQVEYDNSQNKLSLEKLNSIVLEENTVATLLEPEMLLGDIPTIDRIEMQLNKNGLLRIYTTNQTDADTYNWNVSKNICGDLPIYFRKNKRTLQVNLPSKVNLSKDLEYSTIHGNTGINGFLKIFFSEDLQLKSNYTSTLPVIDGTPVTYDSKQNKLSIEKFNTIVLKQNTLATLIDENSLTGDLPAITRMELQLMNNGRLVIYTTNLDDSEFYGWKMSKNIIFETPISIIKNNRSLRIELPSKNILAKDLEYSEIDGIAGINAFIKIYFSNDILFNSDDLQEINGIKLNYNSTQRKLSLEKLNNIVLEENTNTILIDDSMLSADLPSISKIEMQLMKNGSVKVYTTDQSDALIYGWESSFNILV